MKFTGAVPVFLVTIYLGCRISQYYRRRIVLLENIVLFFNMLKLDFRYSYADLISIFERYAESDGENDIFFVSKCIQYMHNGVDFPTAFTAAVQSDKLLKINEKQKLISFGNKLGTSSVETQLDVIDYYKSIFEKNYDDFRKDYNEISRTAIPFCIFIGVGLFIILF